VRQPACRTLTFAGGSGCHRTCSKWAPTPAQDIRLQCRHLPQALPPSGHTTTGKTSREAVAASGCWCACSAPGCFSVSVNTTCACEEAPSPASCKVGEGIRLSIAPCHAMPSQCQSIHLPKHASLARFMRQIMFQLSRLWHSQRLAIALHQAALQHAQPCPLMVLRILAY